MGRATVAGLGLAGLGVAVLAFGAGVAVGMALGDGAVEPDTAPEREVLAPATTSSADAPHTERRHARTPSVATVPDALGALDPGLPTTGTGVITGHVSWDEGRKPLAGVRIVATARVPDAWEFPGSKFPGSQGTLEERVGYYARRFRWDDATRREATTDADGAYSVEGLSDVAYRLNAKVSGFKVRRIPGAETYVPPGSVVDLVASPRTKVTLRVHGPDGTIPENVQINLAAGGQRSSRGWSPKYPELELEPGSNTMVVKAGEFNELRSIPQRLDIKPGDGPRQIDVKVRSAPGIGGRISIEGPTPPPRINVWYLRIRRGSSPTKQQVVASGESIDPSGSNGTYRYALTDLAAGSYAIGVGRQWRTIDVLEIVHVGEEFVRTDLTLPDLDRNACLELSVRAPDGSLLTDVGVTLVWTSAFTSSSMGSNVSVRADGLLWVPFVATHDAATGTHTVGVRSTDYGTIVREFTPSPGARLTIQFAEPARATVSVSGHQGSPAEGRVAVGIRSVAQRQNQNQNQDQTQASVDAKGQALLPPLAPGEYLLRLRLASASRAGRVLVERRVTVTSGNNELAVAMPPLHTLTIDLSGEIGSRTLSVNRDGEYTFEMQSPDKNGRVIFDLLPAGEYTIQVYDGSEAPKKVRIPETTHVTF